jgi:hypothetical protein
MCAGTIQSQPDPAEDSSIRSDHPEVSCALWISSLISRAGSQD